MTRGRFAVWLVAAAFALGPARADDEEAVYAPRPLGAAELQGVHLALDYFAGGAEAWWDRLAPDAPLRTLGREAAIEEIAVRAGPVDATVWQLQTAGASLGDRAVVFTLEFPSGIDDALVLELAEDGSIRTLASLVDPRPVPDDASRMLVLTEDAALPPGRSGPLGPALVAAVSFAILALAILALAFLGILPAGRGARRRPAAVGLAVLAAGAAFVLACRPGPREEAPPPASAAVPAVATAEELPRLGPLRELRETLAGREGLEHLAPFTSDADDLTARVGRLWEAQYLLMRLRLNDAETALQAFETESTLPLRSLLGARLAYLRDDAGTAFERYRYLLAQGPDYDGLRAEIAEVFALLGRVFDSDLMIRELGRQGSRLADTYYLLAQLAVNDLEWERAEEYMTRAWTLRPVERKEIFSEPLLAKIAARPKVYSLFRFDEVDEPLVRIPDGERRPFAFPEGCELLLHGRHLTVRRQGGILEVPDGGVLAPAGTASEDAGTEAEREAAEALSHLDRLSDLSGSLGQPHRRRQLLLAAAALAQNKRWKDLMSLTEGLPESVDTVPSSLVRWRAMALQQVERRAEARHLLVRLAQDEKANRRRDPVTFYQLGEVFASEQEYDLAIRLMQRAYSLSRLSVIEARIHQLEMQKSLATSYTHFESEHFELRFPWSTYEKFPGYLADVLEAERERLKPWIPVKSSTRVEVDLFPFEEFMAGYSQGLEVLGLYDGRVRVPLADIPSLHPIVVAILSHELAHAMLAEATHDQAPRWFHEGLAQHIEMGQADLNPIPDLEKTHRILAFPLLDSVLQGFSEPQLVEFAYRESVWVVHFIEARWGARGIHGMIAAYARGLTTEQAVREVSGMSMAQFERAAWTWCREEAPERWPTEVRRYDREVNPYYRRTRETGPVIQRPGEARPSQPTRAERRADLEERMKAWYRIYSERTRPAKRSLAPLVAAFRKGERPANLGQLCQELSERLRPFFVAGDETLAVPSDQARDYLESAYQAFYTMSEACRRGEESKVRNALDRAEKDLAKAAQVLAHYGMKP